VKIEPQPESYASKPTNRPLAPTQAHRCKQHKIVSDVSILLRAKAATAFSAS